MNVMSVMQTTRLLKFPISLKLIQCNGWKLAYPITCRFRRDTATTRRFFCSSSDGKDTDKSKTIIDKHISSVKSQQFKDVADVIDETQLNKSADDYGTSSSDSDSDSSDSSSSSDGESSSDEEGAHQQDIALAAEKVAKSLPGDSTKTMTDLLAKLREQEDITNEQKEGKPPPKNLKSVLGGLSVRKKWKKREDVSYSGEREQSSDMQEAGQFRNRREQGQFWDKKELGKFRHKRDSDQFWDREGGEFDKRKGHGQLRDRRGSNLDRISLFGAEPLGIFKMMPANAETETPPDTLFDKILKEQRQAEITYPPTNAFEEMSRWTKQGKMWTYPIDNEQGMEDEAQVGFHEHVFLNHCLKDFPKKGPVRHFMELVITGLSKNPYITASQKQDHIEWYKNYFSDKYELIEELTVTADALRREQNKQEDLK